MNYTNKELKDKILRELSYTNRDYDNIVNELIGVLRDVDISRDWDNISSSDPFFIMLHLMAAHKDILNYQIDYSVLEGYMTTARERSSMVRIAQSFGYKVNGYRATKAVYGVETIGDTPPRLEFFESTALDKTTGVNIPWVFTGSASLEVGSTSSRVYMTQGTPAKVVFNSNSIDSINRTKVITNQQISTGVVIDNPYYINLGSNGSIIKIPGTNRSYNEVNNVYAYDKEDKNVYELGEDTLGTTYIKFHNDADLPRDNTEMVLHYVITRGSSVQTAPDRLVLNNGVELILAEDDNNVKIIPGRDPVSAQELKEEFKEYYVGINTLVTLKDYRDRLLKTKTYGLDKVLTIDNGQNSGDIPNSDIGIPTDSAQPGYIAPGEILLVVKPEALDITQAEMNKIKDDLNRDKVTGVSLTIEKATEAILNINISGASDNSQTKNKITEIIKNMVVNLPIAGYLSVGEIYTEILSNQDLAQASRGLNITINGGSGAQLPYNKYAGVNIDI